MEFIHFYGVPEEVGANFTSYAEFFSYYGNLLLPFVCAGSMFELRTKIKKIFPCWRRDTRVIAPQILEMLQMRGNRQI
jgi:hypothetical protein